MQRLTDREIEAILRGNAPSEELEELAGFAREARRYVRRPADAEAHLAAVVQATQARETAPEAVAASQAGGAVRRPPSSVRGGLSSMKRLALALSAALVVATGGLAAAGALPDAAQDALAAAAEKVGFTLPSSDHAGGESHEADLPPSADDVAVAVHTVIANRDDYGNGHEFGQAVAEAAREAAEVHRTQGAGHAPAGVPTSKPEGTPTGAGDAGKPSGAPSGKPSGAPGGQATGGSTSGGSAGTAGGGSAGTAGGGSGASSGGSNASQGGGTANAPALPSPAGDAPSGNPTDNGRP